MKRASPTFAEVAAAKEPAERSRMKGGESFEDPSVSEPFQRIFSVHDDDPCATEEWRVEYCGSDGGCYVRVFAGSEAEKRARDYFEALKIRRLKTIRDS